MPLELYRRAVSPVLFQIKLALPQYRVVEVFFPVPERIVTVLPGAILKPLGKVYFWGPLSRIT